MRVFILPDSAEAAYLAARQIASVVARKPAGALGLATGSSPQPLYEALAQLVGRGEADFRRAEGFALDEYVGIDVGHPESYHSIIARDVVAPLRFGPARVRVPEGLGSLAELDAAAVAYDEAIRVRGGVDVQILGIGVNGHIGFNEPGSRIDTRTRRVDLDPATIDANSRFFDSAAAVPTQAVSQGIDTILLAKAVVLMASGAHKAEAVRAALEGPVDSSCPASFLQTHSDATFYLDAEAASLLGAAWGDDAGDDHG